MLDFKYLCSYLKVQDVPCGIEIFAWQNPIKTELSQTRPHDAIEMTPQWVSQKEHTIMSWGIVIPRVFGDHMESQMVQNTDIK